MLAYTVSSNYHCCRLALENPNYRTEAELQEIRAFKEASCRMLGRKDCLVRPSAMSATADCRCATQTASTVLMAEMAR